MICALFILVLISQSEIRAPRKIEIYDYAVYSDGYLSYSSEPLFIITPNEVYDSKIKSCFETKKDTLLTINSLILEIITQTPSSECWGFSAGDMKSIHENEIYANPSLIILKIYFDNVELFFYILNFPSKGPLREIFDAIYKSNSFQPCTSDTQLNRDKIIEAYALAQCVFYDILQKTGQE